MYQQLLSALQMETKTKSQTLKWIDAHRNRRMLWCASIVFLFYFICKWYAKTFLWSLKKNKYMANLNIRLTDWQFNFRLRLEFGRCICIFVKSHCQLGSERWVTRWVSLMGRTSKLDIMPQTGRKGKADIVLMEIWEDILITGKNDIIFIWVMVIYLF